MTDLSKFQEFIDVVRKLRAPDGCPWDKEQTHDTLRQYLIEEAYELVEAIEENDDELIKEELGDVLLQVILHSVIAEETTRFSIEDVLTKISEKMIRRHPHVFGDVEANTPEQVLKNWDQIKKAEKAQKPQKETGNSLLNSVPKHLPALMRTEKLQKRAARHGFDWPDVSGALNKLKEEIAEMEDAIKNNHSENIKEEVGDLIFSVVNVARKLDIQAEDALQQTNKKFIKRFNYIEEKIESFNKQMKDCSLEELDKFWEEAKQKGFF